MKAPFKSKTGISLRADDATGAALTALGEKPQIYSVEANIEQGGHKFGFLVAQFVPAGGALVQSGPGVLCQTQAEAAEIQAAMNKRKQQHVGVIQWNTGGAVGWLNDNTDSTQEIRVISRAAGAGRKAWFAVLFKTDIVTLARTITRKQKAPSEQAAIKLAEQWRKEIEREAKLPLPPTPPPLPSRCIQLGASDIEDAAAARMKALRRLWPKTLACIEATPRASEQSIADAYLIDLAGQGVQDLSAAPVPMRPDIRLITELAAAAARYKKRGKSTTNTRALYLLAFNWESGWCYKSDAEIASELTAMLKPAKFTAAQVKHFRSRDFELVAKHLPGPSMNA